MSCMSLKTDGVIRIQDGATRARIRARASFRSIGSAFRCAKVTIGEVLSGVWGMNPGRGSSR